MEQLVKHIKHTGELISKSTSNLISNVKKATSDSFDKMKENSYNTIRMVNTQLKYLLPSIEATNKNHDRDVLKTVLKAKPETELTSLSTNLHNNALHYAGKILKMPGIKHVLSVSERISDECANIGAGCAKVFGNVINKVSGKTLLDFDNAPKFSNIFNNAIEETEKLNVSSNAKTLFKATSKLGGVFKALAIGDALYDGKSEKILGVATSIAVGALTVSLTAAAVAAAPITISVAAAGAIIFASGMAGGIGGNVLGEKLGKMLDSNHINLKDNGLSIKHAVEAAPKLFELVTEKVEMRAAHNEREWKKSIRQNTDINSARY